MLKRNFPTDSLFMKLSTSNYTIFSLQIQMSYVMKYTIGVKRCVPTGDSPVIVQSGLGIAFRLDQ